MTELVAARRSPRAASSSAPWLLVALLLLGAGWGSNQFTPMLLVYHGKLGLSTATLEALFGAYAAGLVPGLLIAGRWSDRHGRRPVGVVAAALSLAATASLVAGAHEVWLLFIGRLLAGVGSGAAFGAGTAWLREASLPPVGNAGPAAAGRRAAVAMTAGFAAGPLVAGVLAQWAPAPTVVPYLPHIVLMLAVLAALRAAPETVSEGAARVPPPRLPSDGWRRFRRIVAPMAPWVFIAPTVAFALLPSVVGAATSADGIALTAAVTAITALSGVLIQRWSPRAETWAVPAGVVGLLILSVGLAAAALVAAVRVQWLLIPAGVVLGAAYGLCLTAGLLEVQRLAHGGPQAQLTGAYYVLTYLGFAAPYLLALASHLASYSVLLLLTAGLAAATAVRLGRVQRPG